LFVLKEDWMQCISNHRPCSCHVISSSSGGGCRVAGTKKPPQTAGALC